MILSGVGYRLHNSKTCIIDLIVNSQRALIYLKGGNLLSITLYILNMIMLNLNPENFRILCESSDFFYGWCRFQLYKIYKNKALEIVQNNGNIKSKKRSRRKRWRNGREKKKKSKRKKKKKDKGKKKKQLVISINMTIGNFKLVVLRVPLLLGCPGKVFYRVTEEDWILSLKYLSSVQRDFELSVHPVALYHIGLYLGSDCLINFALFTLLPKDAPYFL